MESMMKSGSVRPATDGKDLLLIMAHPDDAEIWCGGTLVRNSLMGRRTTIVVLASTPERQKEAHDAANLIPGVNLVFLQEEFFGSFSNEKNAAIIARLIDDGQFGALITHNSMDLNPDHRQCFELVQLTLFKTKRDLRIPALYTCNTYNGLNGDGTLFQPSLFVDTSEFFVTKEKMIRCHISQRCNVYIDMCNKMDAFYGLIAGCSFAEAYRRLTLRNTANLVTGFL